MIGAERERMSDDLHFNVDHDGAVMLVVVRGELDAGTVPSLADRINEAMRADTRDVVIDLAQATFFDSSAVRHLLAMQCQLADEHRRLVLSDPSVIVRRVLEICGIADQFEVTPVSAPSTAADGGSAAI